MALYGAQAIIKRKRNPNSPFLPNTALKKAFAAARNSGRLTRAVAVVNLYGRSADMDSLLELCDGYRVPVIEDAAESLGATYRGRASGSLGKYGVFSFNGNKIITTSGAACWFPMTWKGWKRPGFGPPRPGIPHVTTSTASWDIITG